MNKSKVVLPFYLVTTAYFFLSYLLIRGFTQLYSSANSLELSTILPVGCCFILGIFLFKWILANESVFRIIIKELPIQDPPSSNQYIIKPKVLHASLALLELSFWMVIYFMIMDILLFAATLLTPFFIAYLVQLPILDLTFDLIKLICIPIVCYFACKKSIGKPIYNKIYLTTNI